MPPTPPIQLNQFVEWFNAVLGGAVEASYAGTQLPAGKLDEAWHEVTTTGDWIIPAEEQHLSAHRSEQLNIYFSRPQGFGWLHTSNVVLLKHP